MYFLEVTGRGVMFSGRDMELLCRWRDEGATAAIICRGIKEAVLSMEEGEPPRGVRSCQGWIEREIESARERASGGHIVAPHEEVAPEPAPAPAPPAPVEEQTAQPAPTNPYEPLLKDVLAKIEAAGQACTEDTLRAAYRDAWRATRALLERDTLPDPYGALAGIEDALADGYFRALDQQKQQAIADAISADDPAGLAMMSPSAREEHLAARRRSFLMREYGLPSLLD
ncbi:hypothetical protein DN745_01455 [Bradymonas sediminis]|uniref:Uncharacterized protein n=2 Tax=Bradymonas sediminis TaxID=1548548 RepID=A0A2Z4FGK2_9DELT|nr:hypothetical protein DN745_01455 [Bradymonas sediminis]